METTEQIDFLKRRLASARRRVAYWSGRPSFRGFGFNPNSRRARVGGCHVEYETALDDVYSLANELKQLTGRDYATTDLKAQFASKFSGRLKDALAK